MDVADTKSCFWHTASSFVKSALSRLQSSVRVLWSSSIPLALFDVCIRNKANKGTLHQSQLQPPLSLSPLLLKHNYTTTFKKIPLSMIDPHHKLIMTPKIHNHKNHNTFSYIICFSWDPPASTVWRVPANLWGKISRPASNSAAPIHGT